MKPPITADQLNTEFKYAPKAVSRFLANTLRAGGYPSATDRWVRNEINRLLSGGKVRAGASTSISAWLKYGIQ